MVNRRAQVQFTMCCNADFCIMPDLNRSIKEFNGREPTYEAKDWIESLESLSRLNSWPVNVRLQLVQLVRTKMTGAARNWFLGREFGDWTDFVTRFRATFVRELHTTEKWNLIQERV